MIEPASGGAGFLWIGGGVVRLGWWVLVDSRCYAGGMTSSINVRRASRRDLALQTIDDIGAELERLSAAHEAGTLSSTGNWAPGENIEHVVKFMEMSVDGWPVSSPWWLRGIGAVMKLFVLSSIKGAKPMKPGTIQNKGPASFLEPVPGADAGEAIGRGRAIVGRVRGGERFSQPSLIFGELTHEQWEMIHASHCNLHWSFLHVDGAAGGDGGAGGAAGA